MEVIYYDRSEKPAAGSKEMQLNGRASQKSDAVSIHVEGSPAGVISKRK